MTHHLQVFLGLQALILTTVHAQPGRIDTLRIPGRPVSEDRIFIWIPTQGLDSIRNILYMHDGQNLFDPTTTWNNQAWMVRESLDSLITHGHIEHTLLVALPHSTYRHSEYTPERPFHSLPADIRQQYLQSTRDDGTPYYSREVLGNAYLQYLVDQVMPAVEHRYLYHRQSVRSYISGASMGGLISWYAQLIYPDRFSGAACFATHWPLTREIPSPAAESFVSFFYQKIHSIRDSKWYFDYAGRGIDTLYQPYQKTIDQLLTSNLKTQNFKSLYYPDHDHSEYYWMQRFASAIVFLVK